MVCLENNKNALTDQLITFTFKGMDVGFQTSTDDDGCASGIPWGTKYSITPSALGKTLIPDLDIIREFTYDFSGEIARVRISNVSDCYGSNYAYKVEYN